MTWIEEVAAIEDHWDFQASPDGGEIDTAELVPLGYDCQAVGAIEGVEGVGHQGQVGAVTVEALGLLHGYRIEGTDLGTSLPEGLHEVATGGLAHVVGVGLEGQAPEGEGTAGEIAGEVIPDLGEEDLLLPQVDRLDGAQEFGLIAN